MMLRRQAHYLMAAPTRGRMTGGARRQPNFAPEAYGDFAAVADDRIAEAQRRVNEEYGFGSGRWQVVEDIVR